MASFSTREQIAIIKFLTAKGENPISIHQQLVTVSKTTVMDVKNVRKWQNMFRNGRESCDDATRSGRPVTSTTDAVVVAVEQLIMQDRRITVDEIAAAMGISHGTAHTILHEKLNMNKVSACHARETTRIVGGRVLLSSGQCATTSITSRTPVLHRQ